MALCAYCGPTENKITREHIIPKFIYEYQSEHHKISGWNEVAKKTISGEIKVKDVCDNCNNNILGKLDYYAKQFLSQHGVLTDIFLSEEMELKYDYDLLLRWLLKLSFNAARQDGTQAPLFVDSVPYMLGLRAEEPLNIDVVVQVLKPVQHSAGEIEMLNGLGVPVSDCGKTNPFIARIGKALISGSNGGFIIRTVIMGALIFYIFIYEAGLGAVSREQLLRTFMQNLKSGTILKKNSSSIHLAAGKMNWIEAYGASVFRAKFYENKR
ncbi:hypothetical protein [Pseudomonas farris]